MPVIFCDGDRTRRSPWMEWAEGATGRRVNRDHPLPGAGLETSMLTNKVGHEMTILGTAIKIILFHEAGERRDC